MMIKHIRNCICVLLLAAAAFFLDGCSFRPESAKTPEGETLFRLGFAGTPASLNPYAACDPEAETAISLLYDTLFSEDLTTGEPVGSLCTEYTVTNASSGVGKLWNITIRDDVYWSDGERLTSGDVEFSLQSLKDLSARYGYPFCELLDTTGIAIVDDTHLAMIVWGEESVVKACLSRVPILPRHIWNEPDYMRYDVSGVASDPVRAAALIGKVPAEASVMVGSGLYTWGGYGNGVLTLRLNRAYGNGTSKAEVLELCYGLEDPAAALAENRVDACADMSLNGFRSLSENEAVRTSAGTDGVMYQMAFGFASDRSPVRDSAVRRAAEYCTARDALLLYAFGGGYAERGMISPFSAWYSMNESVFDRPYDTATASSLLQNAGWTDTDSDGVREKNGVPLSLTMLCANEAPAWERAARFLKTTFAAAGAEIRVVSVSSDRFAESLASGDWDLCLIARETRPEPWMSFGYYFWDGGDNAYAETARLGRVNSPGWNDSGYSSAEFDRLYKELTASTDPEEIRRLSDEAGEYLYNDSAAVTIGFSVVYQACSRVWMGLRAASDGRYFSPETISEQMRTVSAGR